MAAKSIYLQGYVVCLIYQLLKARPTSSVVIPLILAKVSYISFTCFDLIKEYLDVQTCWKITIALQNYGMKTWSPRMLIVLGTV